jgi:hypothetical protein
VVAEQRRDGRFSIRFGSVKVAVAWAWAVDARRRPKISARMTLSVGEECGNLRPVSREE